MFRYFSNDLSNFDGVRTPFAIQLITGWIKRTISERKTIFIQSLVSISHSCFFGLHSKSNRDYVHGSGIRCFGCRYVLFRIPCARWSTWIIYESSPLHRGVYLSIQVSFSLVCCATHVSDMNSIEKYTWLFCIRPFRSRFRRNVRL